jgi:hypothetical protein
MNIYVNNLLALMAGTYGVPAPLWHVPQARRSKGGFGHARFCIRSREGVALVEWLNNKLELEPTGIEPATPALQSNPTEGPEGPRIPVFPAL